MQDTNIFWTHLQQISQEDKLRIVDSLLACSTIKDKGSRDTVLNLLDSRISNSVSKHPVDQIEVTNIVIASLSHPGGLRELIGKVEYFEKNSQPMRRLKELLQETSIPHMVVSRELFKELIQIAQHIEVSRQELVDFYLQSAPRGWLSPQGSDEAEMLVLMLGKLVQARRREKDVFPIVKFVERLAAFAIAHEQAVGEELNAWVRKAVQAERLGEAYADVQHQDVPFQAVLERPPSLLVKFRPVPNEPNLVRIEACFLGEQKGYEKWLHVDEQPRTLETVPELLDQLTAHSNEYIKNSMHKLTVEVFLPITFLNYDMDQWMIDAGLNNMIPISKYYPLIVRSLERIESGDTSGARRMRNAWKQSWATFERQAAALKPHFLHRQDCEREIFSELLDVICLAFTFVPPKVLNGDPHVFSTMIGAGVPIALWPHYCDEQLDEHKIKNVYNSFLLGCDFSTLPIMIWKKRKMQGEHPLLQQLVLLWDDPNRLPHKDRKRIAAPQKKGSA